MKGGCTRDKITFNACIDILTKRKSVIFAAIIYIQRILNRGKLIRAVAGQRSSPELCLANKTKMHLKQENEFKIARL